MDHVGREAPMSTKVIRRGRLDLKDDRKLLSPPSVDEPLYQSATAVTVRGYAVNAEIAVRVVRTGGPILARALGPALFVGNVAVTHSEPAGDSLYRFLAFDVDRPRARAPTAWGWMDAGKNERVRTRYRYEVAPD
jgi:hypothetical protein